jgi:hypothetical protein
MTDLSPYDECTGRQIRLHRDRTELVANSGPELAAPGPLNFA